MYDPGPQNCTAEVTLSNNIQEEEKKPDIFWPKFGNSGHSGPRPGGTEKGQKNGRRANITENNQLQPRG